jgi:hypothetical protein
LLKTQFDRGLFIVLSLAFIIATVIGTLSHEFGHYIFARAAGYKSSIHYAYTHVDDLGLADSINNISTRYSKELEEGSYFPGKDEYDKLIRLYTNNSRWISIGGPLQTLLTGTIGLILLFVYKRSFKQKERLNARQWILIFLTLFWLRQTTNMIIWIGSSLLMNRYHHSDEIGIALKLGLPHWLLLVATGLIGLVILAVVVFKFIPKTQWLTFVISGIVGGIAGYILWLILLGPVLLP